ncbi:MAG TPA: hypothetical protein VFA21_20370 [Pyrinomonadaceae bacterium]|nr:hypothetical protein [Pyrinomonadaceae bacterium]
MRTTKPSLWCRIFHRSRWVAEGTGAAFCTACKAVFHHERKKERVTWQQQQKLSPAGTTLQNSASD